MSGLSRAWLESATDGKLLKISRGGPECQANGYEWPVPGGRRPLAQPMLASPVVPVARIGTQALVIPCSSPRVRVTPINVER
jgi:hypothetical protein